MFCDWANKRTANIYAPEDTRWGRVIDALGGKLLVNESRSSGLVRKHPDSYETQRPAYPRKLLETE